MAEWNAKPVPRRPSASRSVSDDSDQDSVAPVAGKARRKQDGGGGLKRVLSEVRDHLKAGRYEEAQALLEDALDKQPEAALLYLGMGNVLAARGAFEQAIEYYTGALHLKTNWALPLIMAGKAYVHMDRLDKALEQFEAALALNPGLEQARLHAVRVHRRMGDMGAAEACLRAALTHNPASEDAAVALSDLCRRRGDDRAAEDPLEAVLSRNPAAWKARGKLVRLLLSTGRLDEAVDAAQKGLAVKTDAHPIRFLLACAYMRLEQYECALREYTTLSEFPSRMTVARIGMAEAMMKLGRLTEARKLLVALAGEQSHLDRVHRLLAEIMMREENYPAALDECKAAVLHSGRIREGHPPEFEVRGSDYKAAAEAFLRACPEVPLEALGEPDPLSRGGEE